MNITELKLSELKPYEKNPRRNDEAVEYVAKSIEQFGFKVPIIIDKDNIIVTGHTRYKAAQKLGMESVPCIKADDLTEEQVKAFRLADNKVAEFSAWDFDLLNEELEGILDLDMSELGFQSFDEVNLDDFFEESQSSPKEEKEEVIVCPYCNKEFTQ
jgi:site-specific DNA-methyltransferase (adenine-specific)